MLLVLAGCSSDEKVGDESLLNVRDEVARQRLGERATTVVTAPPSSVAGGERLGVTQTTSPTTLPAAAATTAPDRSFVITINSDRAGGASQFEPNTATVYVGTPVRFVNNDTVARSVVADNNAFRSPAIPPGGSWTFTPSTPGSFGYQDGTRPYAVGRLQVVAR